MDRDKLAARLANLSTAKRTLLELHLKDKSFESLVIPTVSRRSAGESAPLSFAQQRLWFLNQLEPESPVYNESNTVRLSGILHLDAFKKALNQIVRRHEVLRTTILTVDGSPCQVVMNHRELDLPVIDLEAAPQTLRDSEVQRLITQTIRKPFDLSRDLMLRVLLLRLANEEHIFLVVKHHIASDGWSSGIFWRELSSLYLTFVSGKPCSLPELPIQYADYAIWQRGWLQGEVLDRKLSYWTKQIEGIPTVLDMPTDRPRPAVQTYRGASQSVELSDDLSEALKKLSRREGVTLFMTLLAGFQALLHRYTDQKDIVVGCPIAGRTRQELEGLIGFFVNTLVIRVNFSGNPTFRELLGRVRKVTLEAYGHQDLPFEKLVEEVQPERNLSHSPLFQVVFAYQNTPKRPLEIPGVLVTPVAKQVETTKFDLHLSINNAEDRIRATLYYATDLYNDVTMARLLGHFRVLLENIVADPYRRISELPILTEAEKQQLFIEWNDTGRDHSKDKCLHHCFEEQVERTPSNVALVFQGQQLTYRELNRKANQLAHYLRKLGVGPEVLVGICVERSLEMVLGILGILKAGGAYLPLGTEYPKERLAFMVEESWAPVLLTQQRWVEKFSATQARVVCLDRDWEEIDQQSEENPDSVAAPQNLAYVIYTSGSTGTPKGVEVPHRAVVNFLHSMREEPGFTSRDTLVAVSTLSFDIAGLEIFLPLCAGARTVLASAQITTDGSQLATLLEASSATVMQATPATWRLLIQAGWRAPKNFKILCGGEELPRELANSLLDSTPFVWNMYGPTETTIWSAVDRVKPGTGIVTIGRPIANTQLYILDTYFNPVPVGVHGELCIGGMGVARGYRNRPELGADKFVPDPFSTAQGGRLYKTGDRARYLSDGKIEFLGRMDSQIKLRGYRIELGEIETILSRHPSISQAVVAVKEIADDKRLVGYVVAREGHVLNYTQLKDFLRAQLPEYMVPSTFVMVGALPLTPNAKVNRLALPLPDASRPDLVGAFVAPRNPAEKVLASIWAEVLKLEKLGIRDSFFDLGGHSILATQVISRIREAFRVDLPVRIIFERPTIEDLALVIEETLIEEIESLSEEAREQT